MLAVVLVVVVALGVVRLGQGRTGPTPTPGPTPTGASSHPAASDSASADGWPVGVGLPSGTVWVLAGDGISRLDVTSGFLDHLGLEVDPARTVLTPLAPGAVAWSPSGRAASLLGLDRESGDPLRRARAVLPGPAGTVWARTAAPAGGVSTWVQADGDGVAGPRVAVRGTALADGAGGLLEVRDGAVRHVYPGRVLDLGRARVLAVGPDGYVLDRCGDGTCSAELHRTDGAVDPVLTEAAPNPQPDRSEVAPGSVSPGDRYLVETLPTEVGDQVRVSRVSAVAEVLRTFPAGDRRSSEAWLSDRWLLAVSEDHLVLYDAATDTLLTPDLGLDGPTQVVFVPA